MDFTGEVKPLPGPSPTPVMVTRCIHTPCSAEELVATLMTALREAGRNTVTVTCSNHGIDLPTVEFNWEEER